MILFSMAVAPSSDPLAVHGVPTSPQPHQRLFLSESSNHPASHEAVRHYGFDLRFFVAVSRSSLDILVFFFSIFGRIVLFPCYGFQVVGATFHTGMHAHRHV